MPSFGDKSPKPSFGAAAPRPATPAAAPASAAYRPLAAPAQAARQPSPFRGLPPADPSVDTSGGGGGYEKRDDSYWDAHPFASREEPYVLTCYVSKIMLWASGEPVVHFKAMDWDKDANRPGAHHQRPVPDRWGWKQTPSPKQVENPKAYAYWRRDIVKCYASCGYPEADWPTDEAGSPVPPWFRFFVHQGPDGLFVPIMFNVHVKVEAARATHGVFANVRDVVPLPGPVQAPMPWEVPPLIAHSCKWNIAEERTIAGKDGSVTHIAVVDKNTIPLGHLGMRTWKDL